jgi:hypothetical protein
MLHCAHSPPHITTRKCLGHTRAMTTWCSRHEVVLTYLPGLGIACRIGCDGAWPAASHGWTRSCQTRDEICMLGGPIKTWGRAPDTPAVTVTSGGAQNTAELPRPCEQTQKRLTTGRERQETLNICVISVLGGISLKGLRHNGPGTHGGIRIQIPNLDRADRQPRSAGSLAHPAGHRPSSKTFLFSRSPGSDSEFDEACSTSPFAESLMLGRYGVCPCLQGHRYKGLGWNGVLCQESSLAEAR